MFSGSPDQLTPELLRAMVGALTEGIIVVDSSGQHLFANRAGLVELGFVDGQSIPARREAIVALWPDGSPMAAEHRPSTRAFAGETVIKEPLIHRGPRGDRLLEVSAIPLSADPATGHARVLIIFHDITDEQTLRAELRSFARVVAHDLQNPLTAVEWWVELASDEITGGRDLPHASASTVLDRVGDAAKRMSGLISDLLAHALSRDSELVRQPVDLADVVSRIVEGRAAESYVSVGELPKIEGDPVLITQAFDNVIGNALKYVSPGTDPRVTVVAEQNGQQVIVTVTDEGVGIPDDELSLVFNEFHRGHTAHYGGSGLGLAIVKRAVTRHGGTVAARPNPKGQGTVIEICLPVR